MKFTYMFLEIEVPTKSFLTYAARVWLLFIVSMHMKCKIIHLVESLVTNIAFVLFLCAMCKFMILVVPLLVKSFSAKFTRERLVVKVNPHVCVKRAATVECLPACFTLVRLLLSVDNFVATQGACLTKTFTAYFANKWPSTCKIKIKRN